MIFRIFDGSFLATLTFFINIISNPHCHYNHPIVRFPRISNCWLKIVYKIGQTITSVLYCQLGGAVLEAAEKGLRRVPHFLICLFQDSRALGLLVPAETHSQLVEHSLQIDVTAVGQQVAIIQEFQVHPQFLLSGAIAHSLSAVQFVPDGRLFDLSVLGVAEGLAVVAEGQVVLECIFELLAPGNHLLGLLVGTAHDPDESLAVALVCEIQFPKLDVDQGCGLLLTDDFEESGEAGVYFEDVDELFLGFGEGGVLEDDEGVALDGLHHFFVVVDVLGGYLEGHEFVDMQVYVLQVLLGVFAAVLADYQQVQLVVTDLLVWLYLSLVPHDVRQDLLLPEPQLLQSHLQLALNRQLPRSQLLYFLQRVDRETEEIEEPGHVLTDELLVLLQTKEGLVGSVDQRVDVPQGLLPQPERLPRVPAQFNALLLLLLQELPPSLVEKVHECQVLYRGRNSGSPLLGLHALQSLRVVERHQGQFGEQQQVVRDILLEDFRKGQGIGNVFGGAKFEGCAQVLEGLVLAHEGTGLFEDGGEGQGCVEGDSAPALDELLDDSVDGVVVAVLHVGVDIGPDVVRGEKIFLLQGLELLYSKAALEEAEDSGDPFLLSFPDQDLSFGGVAVAKVLGHEVFGHAEQPGELLLIPLQVNVAPVRELGEATDADLVGLLQHHVQESLNSVHPQVLHFGHFASLVGSIKPLPFPVGMSLPQGLTLETFRPK